MTHVKADFRDWQVRYSGLQLYLCEVQTLVPYKLMFTLVREEFTRIPYRSCRRCQNWPHRGGLRFLNHRFADATV